MGSIYNITVEGVTYSRNRSFPLAETSCLPIEAFALSSFSGVKSPIVPGNAGNSAIVPGNAGNTPYPVHTVVFGGSAAFRSFRSTCSLSFLGSRSKLQKR
ncbi:hypothetical protein [Moorena producens]|uniref:hypothetical protein n=1 Tax=Moorena producens TaxID=1155739 RepID=UPI003C75D797